MLLRSRSASSACGVTGASVLSTTFQIGGQTLSSQFICGSYTPVRYRRRKTENQEIGLVIDNTSKRSKWLPSQTKIVTHLHISDREPLDARFWENPKIVRRPNPDPTDKCKCNCLRNIVQYYTHKPNTNFMPSQAKIVKRKVLGLNLAPERLWKVNEKGVLYWFELPDARVTYYLICPRVTSP